MADLLNSASRGKRVKPMSRAGKAGVAVRGGYIEDNETNADLKGQRKFKTYAELLANVAIVAASVRYLLNLIGKAKWTVVPAATPRGEEIAEIVESTMDDMERPWHRVVRRSAMYRFHGYAWQEWIAKKREDGLIGYLDIEPRAHSTIVRWDVDEAGVVFGVIQEPPQDFRNLYLPRAKAIYIVDDAISDSPEGLGILRHVYPAAQTMQAYERLEGVGFETDLRGVPVGRAPYSMIQEKLKANEISETDAALMTSIIESFVEDHVRGTTTGLVLDSEVYSAKGDTENPSATGLWGMDLLSTASTGQEAAANAVNRLVRSIARLFGTEGLLLGESGGGSLALSKDKSNQFGLIVDGSLVEISGQYEKDYLGPLAAMNGWAKEDLPKFKTEKLQHRELTEVTDALEGLAKAGAPIIQSDPAVNVVREAMGLPEQDMEAIELDSALRAAEGVQPGAVDDEGEEGEGERATANSETIGDEE